MRVPHSLILPGFAILAALGGMIPAPAASAADEDREMTATEFHEWDYFNGLGWTAVQKSDFVAAARRFKTAIDFARIGSRKDPRLLARSYADLAYVLHRQGRSAEAEPLARWSLQVREKYFREGSEPIAQILYTLAMIELETNKLADAERDLNRAVKNYETLLGADSPRLVPYLNDLALLYMTERKYARAEPIYSRCLAMDEKTLPPSDPGRLVSLFGMGNVCLLEGQYEKAEPFYKKALEQLERRDSNPALHADILDNYASILQQTNRAAEAKSMHEHAREIRTQLEPNPPAATSAARPTG